MVQQFDASHYYSAHLTLSGSPLLTATTNSSAGWQPAYCTEWFTTGKYYFEATQSATRLFVGGGNSSASVALGNFPGLDTLSFGIDIRENGGGGFWSFNGSSVGTATPAMTGPVFGIAWDLVNGFAWVKDVTGASSWYGSTSLAGDPTIPSQGFPMDSTMRSGGNGLGISPAIGLVNSGESVTVAFDAASWVGTPPTGFTAFDPAAATSVPVWLYFGQSLALGAGAKLARDLIRNPIRSRRRLLTGRDDR